METNIRQAPKFTNVKRTIFALILLSIITFLAGFLQDTEYGYVIYILYFILLLGGVKLIKMTLNLQVTGALKAFLLITGYSSVLYFVYFLYALLKSELFDAGLIEVLTELEGLFYLAALIFIISSIGSLIMLIRRK